MTLIKFGCDDISAAFLIVNLELGWEWIYWFVDRRFWILTSLFTSLLSFIILLIFSLRRFFPVDSHFFFNNLVTYINGQFYIQVLHNININVYYINKKRSQDVTPRPLSLDMGIKWPCTNLFADIKFCFSYRLISIIMKIFSRLIFMFPFLNKLDYIKTFAIVGS